MTHFRSNPPQEIQERTRSESNEEIYLTSEVYRFRD